MERKMINPALKIKKYWHKFKKWLFGDSDSSAAFKIAVVVFGVWDLIGLSIGISDYYFTQKDSDKATCYLEQEWVKCPQSEFRVKSNLVNGVYSVQKSEHKKEFSLFYSIQVGLPAGGSVSLKVGEKNLDEVIEMLENLAEENASNK